MQKLPQSFYTRSNVIQIAKDLLGKIIVTKFNNQYAVARIVEVESYAGIVDRASHAYGGRRTKRTEIMYGCGGTAYIYFCYGMHHLFNVVTNKIDIPEAVLIRGVEPLDGIKVMLKRCGKSTLDNSIGRGPGNVSKALGIVTKQSGVNLLGKNFYIADDNSNDFEIMTSKRIGVDYAGKHANWLHRFFIKDHPQVTKHPFNNKAKITL